MNNDSSFIVLTLITVVTGASAALFAWWLAKVLSDVPDEDREYKDPPPAGFRLLWPLIQPLSFYIEPWMGDKTTKRQQRKLMNAGLEYSLSPAQFLAGRLVCALCTALFFSLVVSLLDSHRSWASSVYWQAALAGAMGGFLYPVLWLNDRIAARKTELLKSLPFFLDIITLCVEAGLNLQGAMAQAVAKGPKGIMRAEFLRVLRDIRAGKQRAEALRNMAARLREPAITAFVQAVIQAESMGMSLGPVLRAQADHRRTERFLRAEKKAMEAPVKMLFPLIAFIFPCTFLILFFPIVVKFMNSGL
ncbi:type II secretion system F family protein [Aquabacterium lacunae]|uniref:Type II secretion system F family protein n=1 Tax=Aquabacterium lacunae TaxID=2528630 RepID=A0A4Q9H176_9BURK|nr:type II secretion system F family protein [Aquabacterium lacunae]TBO33043.1 type II secretion system F family protein [Aquabacterium lacunae]